ncbi:type II secretion system GspH family protein [Patescibacteria group bacterium]|nr:type II secretion system GspH family protein [Patescibacteria group bacterium]
MTTNRAINKERGFTLIELLVVIAIIGILSSVVLASLNTARTKARDAKRISEVRQIQTALALYYDKYGQYPGSGECGATVPNSSWSNSVECLSGGRWLRDSATNLSAFIASDPIDPINQNNWPRGAYYYFSRGYGGDKQWYLLVYSLENFPNPLIENSDGVTAPDGSYFHYGNGSDGIITVGVGK